LQIGNVTINSNVALAPMAGVTDLAFRQICRECGAGYTVTEMVSARGIIHNSEKTEHLMRLNNNEHPCAIQIFGNDAQSVAYSAKFAAEKYGCDIVDINMGCPTPKIVNNGDGSALMKNIRLAEEIIRETVKECPVPVTVKFRAGWDSGSINAVEFAQMAQGAGASAIIIHPRTRVQMYSGRADHTLTRKVKLSVSIPVIHSGDVYCAEEAKRVMDMTGADMIMIGRAALGNPWIFRQAECAINGDDIPPLPPLSVRCDTAVSQFEIMRTYKGDYTTCMEARKHYNWYLHGVAHSAYYKDLINKISSFDDIYRITAGIKNDLK